MSDESARGAHLEHPHDPAYHEPVTTFRDCAQCGSPFTPEREHARFCSACCRMAWNRRNGGGAAAPAAAIGWAVTAMTEAVERFARARPPDLSRAASSLGEAVWLITLVDATLVRYHPRAYENTLSLLGHRHRRGIEEALAGLRYIRNQIGRAADPATMISPGAGGIAWAWSPLPEPALADARERAREWELSRYHAHRARLARHDAARTLARCAMFLEQAATAATADDAPPASANAT